jgi:hypothetical protein
MAEIRHRVGIDGSAAEIYRLLTTDAGLSKWWTTDTSGAGDKGSIIYFRFGNDGPRFEVIELVPDKRVRCDRQTYVNFSHYNWQQADDFLAHCSTKWGVFMMSLKSCIETGKGRPFPDDVHIDFDE